LDRFDDAEQEMLAAGGEQIDAVEIESSACGWKIGFGGEPFASVAAAERGGSKRAFLVEHLSEEMFPGSRFAFEGGEMEARSNDFCLKEETAHSGTYADKVFGRDAAFGELRDGRDCSFRDMPGNE
jgi:hypothetical protein